MISIIITAYKEAKTIGRAINAVLKQKINESFEVLCVAPDKETAGVIKSYSRSDKRIKYLEDLHKGKPSALNLAISKAKGRILVLTDGDVVIGNGSINQLIKPFSNELIGVVSSRPISVGDKNKMLGFWGHILFQTAHELRLKSSKGGLPVHSSGYLYAIRAGLVKSIPRQCIDDGFISEKIFSMGYKIFYNPRARVFVKNPSSISDWFKQKIRNTSGYRHLYSKGLSKDMKRNLFWEMGGFYLIIKHCKNIRELWWVFLLSIARIYIWSRATFKSEEVIFGSSGWVRVESTK